MAKAKTQYLPKYVLIKEAIKRDFVNDGLRIGDLVPTERDLCKRHDAANLTIRRALDELVSEGIVKREYKSRGVIQKMPVFSEDRRYSHSAATRKIPILAPWNALNSTNTYLNPVIQVLVDLLQSNEWLTRVATIPGPPGEPKYIREQLSGETVDGLITFGLCYEESAKAIFDSGIPAVMIDYAPKSITIDSVVTDNQAIAHRIMRHLTGLGHKRIDFIGQYAIDHPDADALEQEDVWRRFLAENGGTGRSEYYSVKREPVSENLKRLFAVKDPPTAIYIPNLFVAGQVELELRTQGYRIPEDISLITVGGLIGDRDTNLTAIQVNWVEMARLAVRRLDDLINGEAQPGARLTHAGGLIDRGSTAKPAQGAKKPKR